MQKQANQLEENITIIEDLYKKLQDTQENTK